VEGSGHNIIWDNVAAFA